MQYAAVFGVFLQLFELDELGEFLTEFYVHFAPFWVLRR